MKKNNIYLIVLYLGVISFLASCDKDKPELTYTGTDFIAFQDTVFSIEENTGSNFEIVVMRASSKSDVNITLDLVVSSPDATAVEGTHYNIISPADGKLTFGKDQYFDTIVVDVIDNVDEDGAKTLSFSLSGNTDGFVLGMPGPASRQKSCELIISDNDCAFFTQDFSGKLSGVEFYPNSPYPTEVEFTLVDSTETTYIYEVTNIMKSVYAGWGEIVDAADAGTGSNANIALVTLDFTDPFNPTVYFEEQNLSTTNGGAWIYDIYNSTTITSKFSTCDKTIELYYLINVSEPGTDYGASECYIKGEFVKE
jgi:hypothetical protein